MTAPEFEERINFSRPRPEPTRPSRTDPDSEWRSIDAPLSVIETALEAMARELVMDTRVADGRTHWHGDVMQPALWVDVAANAVGEATEVGVRIVAAGTDLSGRPTLNVARFFTLYWLSATAFIIALMWLAVGDDPAGDTRMVTAIALFNLAVYLALGFVFGVVPAWRRRRALAAWSRDWRMSFWSALEGRVAPPTLYR